MRENKYFVLIAKCKNDVFHSAKGVSKVHRRDLLEDAPVLHEENEEEENEDEDEDEEEEEEEEEKEEEEVEVEDEEDTRIMKQSLDDKNQPRGDTHRSFCCDSGIEILNFTVQLPRSGTSLIRESLHSKN
ncbi:hypothetical protein V1477_012766 [Vespula maculifrons]|uniref:Uncharacterized protein n=1 Tax=Vespula maculifrons TaxID=7453 RepID=A0ABD2BTZ4_VESMC